MKRKIRKKLGECSGCHREKLKRDYFGRSIWGERVFVCTACMTPNSPEIFTQWVELEKQELVFGKPIK